MDLPAQSVWNNNLCVGDIKNAIRPLTAPVKFPISENKVKLQPGEFLKWDSLVQKNPVLHGGGEITGVALQVEYKHLRCSPPFHTFF